MYIERIRLFQKASIIMSPSVTLFRYLSKIPGGKNIYLRKNFRIETFKGRWFLKGKWFSQCKLNCNHFKRIADGWVKFSGTIFHTYC